MRRGNRWSVVSSTLSVCFLTDRDLRPLTTTITTTSIGSYTFAKTLEYKVKQGVNAGKEVTVVPPNEYQERFVSAMDDYFLACPGVFSANV